MRWLPSLFGIWYTWSSGLTPWSSSFKYGSRFGLGVSGEEVYLGLGVDWEEIWVEYHPEGSKVGNSRGLLESESVTSCEGGLLWFLVFFPVLHLLAINKLTKQC